MWPYTFLINTFKALCGMQIYSFPLLYVVFISQSKASQTWIISHLHYSLYWGHLHLGNWGIKELSKIMKPPLYHYFWVPNLRWLKPDLYPLWHWILYCITFPKHTCWRRGWHPWHSNDKTWEQKFNFPPPPTSCAPLFKMYNKI